MSGTLARNDPDFIEEGLKIISGLNHVETLTDDVTLDASYPNVLRFDPGGAGRTVTLDAEALSDGLVRLVENVADAVEDLTFNDDSGSLVAVVRAGEIRLFHCDGSTWRSMPFKSDEVANDLVAGFFDDFVGDIGATIPVPWVTNLQTANITVDYLSGAGMGVVRFLSDNTSEAQAGNITHGDALHYNMSKNPIFEFLIRIAPAGAAFTADERLVIGLGSAHANAEDALDSVVTNAWFRIEGASMNILVEADDGTTDTDDQDSTIVLVKSAWTKFKIDCSDLSDIKFFVDDVEQGGATVSMADLAADTFVQPIVCIQRAAGAEVNTLDIDYIDLNVDR